MEMMKRFMCVAVALLAVANTCRAQDSLEDKLAKLEAASKTRKTTVKSAVPKSTVKVSSATDILRGKVKTLAERLDEMDNRQKGMQETGKGLDARLAAIESRFAASKTESRSRAQKAHDALYAKLAELDTKVQGLQDKAEQAVAQQVVVSATAKTQDVAAVSETAAQATPEQQTEVAQVAEPAQV